MPSYQPDHCWWLCFILWLHEGGSGLRLKDGLFVKPLPVGWGLTICLWLGPPWFNYWFSFTLSHSRISHEYSSLFIVTLNLICNFSLWCIDRLGSLYANRIFMYFRIKSCIGTQSDVSWLSRSFKSPVVYSADRSKAVVPELVLPFVPLWKCSTRQFVWSLALCCLDIVFFSPFSIWIASLWEVRANLSAFRTFVRFALVWFCLFPLPLGVWKGLRFVIVALPGVFCYFFKINNDIIPTVNASSVSSMTRKRNQKQSLNVLQHSDYTLLIDNL